MISQWMADGIAASVWTLVWHWGTGIGIIILLLAAAYLSPILKKDFVYAAVIVAVALSIYGYGAADDKKLCDARMKNQLVKLHENYKFIPKQSSVKWW